MNIRVHDSTIINVDLNHYEILLKANKKTKIILDDEEICINQIYRKKIVNDN
jgi:hypothetical protein